MISLKAARIKIGLTQAQAARKLKVTKNTVANWEKGNSFPSADKIRGIEKLYNVSYNEIIFLPNNYT